jgi:hypothetical protein
MYVSCDRCPAFLALILSSLLMVSRRNVTHAFPSCYYIDNRSFDVKIIWMFLSSYMVFCHRIRIRYWRFSLIAAHVCNVSQSVSTYVLKYDKLCSPDYISVLQIRAPARLQVKIIHIIANQTRRPSCRLLLRTLTLNPPRNLICTVSEKVGSDVLSCDCGVSGI